MQLADASQPFGQPPRGKPQPGLIHHVNVVVVFGPIVAYKDHRSLLDRFCVATTFEPEDTRRRPNGSVLNARGTTSHQSYRRPRQPVGARSRTRNRLSLQDPTVLTDQRLGDQPRSGKG